MDMRDNRANRFSNNARQYQRQRLFGRHLYPPRADATVVDGAVESAKLERLRRLERQGNGHLYAALEHWLNR